MQTGTGRLGRARGSITSVGNAALRAPSREPAEGRTPGGQVPAEGPPCHGLCHRVIFILSEGRGLGARSQGLCCVLGPRLSSVVSWARATVNTQKAKSVFQTRKCLVVTPRGAAPPLLREPRPEPPGLHSDLGPCTPLFSVLNLRGCPPLASPVASPQPRRARPDATRCSPVEATTIPHRQPGFFPRPSSELPGTVSCIGTRIHSHLPRGSLSDPGP